MLKSFNIPLTEKGSRNYPNQHTTIIKQNKQLYLYQI
jgi:hypothetical protein